MDKQEMVDKADLYVDNEHGFEQICLDFPDGEIPTVIYVNGETWAISDR